MKRFFTILMVCLSLACVKGDRPFYYVDTGTSAVGPIEVHTLRIDPEFSPSDVASIVLAVGEWNYVMSGYVRIDIKYGLDMGNDYDWMVMRVEGSSSLIHDRKPYRTLAWVNRVGGRYMWIIRDRVNAQMIHGILLHELGHLLGAEHDGIYLMSAYYDAEDYACVDYQTAWEVAIAHELDVRLFRYCEHAKPPFPLPKF